MNFLSKIFYKQFHLRLFWSVVGVFVSLTLVFFVLQYFSEKQFKTETFNSKLLEHNDYVHFLLKKNYPFDELAINEKMRTTVIDLTGKVLFDSEVKTVQNIENHADRPEIQAALQKGSGYDVRRKSKTTGEYYFYSAKRYDNCIIRSAMPYDNELAAALKIDANVIYITLSILAVLILIFYNVMRHLGKNINQLKNFALQADKEETIIQNPAFSNDELGEISQHIVRIYNRLISTRKKLQDEQILVLEQIEEKDTIKRQLTQNISHELKTPVSSIQGYLETIINNKELDREIVDDFVKKSYIQSTRLSTLLSDISTLTRLDEASEMIEKEEVNISELIRSIFNDVSLQLAEKNIRISTNIAEKSLLCYGNSSLLYSIFRNLIDNTIAYAGTGIDIDLQCDDRDPALYRFTYSDNGIGIEPKHLSRIFERFYRIDKGRSRKAGGTGLGLAIVKNAVIFHGGTISARPRNGGGVEFLFSVRKG
jgi:signal transduction histidine kinase